MQISNSTYDALKRVVTVVLPATAALYVTLAALWNLPNPEAVAGTLAAIATFGGVVMNISAKSWNTNDDRFDGELITTGYNEDTGLPNLELNISENPNDLLERGVVVLRAVSEV